MRLVRLVVAGVVLGAVTGFVAALLRPRAVYRRPVGGVAPVAPLPERDGIPMTELPAPAEVMR